MQYGFGGQRVHVIVQSVDGHLRLFMALGLAIK